MKRISAILTIIALLATVAIAGWFLIGWIIGGAFGSVTRTGESNQSFGVLEASFGNVLPQSDFRSLRADLTMHGGVVEYTTRTLKNCSAITQKGDIHDQ